MHYAPIEPTPRAFAPVLRFFQLMMCALRLAVRPVIVGFLLGAGSAHAQYKNQSFALDAAAITTTRPSSYDNSVLLQREERPFRPNYGARLGFELGRKETDNFWLTFRGNVGVINYGVRSSDSPIQQTFDQGAQDVLGTMLSTGGQFGMRYYLQTDNFRPYVQLATSYSRLIGFKTDIVPAECAVCTNADQDLGFEFLPHRNLWGLHLEPGIEWITKTDRALVVFADLTNWVIFNAADTQGATIGLRMSFYM